MTTKVKPSSQGQLQCQTLESPCWCPGCCSFQRPDFASWFRKPCIIYDIYDIWYMIYNIWLRRDLSDQLLVRRETSTGSRSCVQFAEKALGAIVLVLGAAVSTAKTILVLMSFWNIDTTLKIMSFCQTSGSYAMETFSATSEILATGIVERSPPI